MRSQQYRSTEIVAILLHGCVCHMKQVMAAADSGTGPPPAMRSRPGRHPAIGWRCRSRLPAGCCGWLGLASSIPAGSGEVGRTTSQLGSKPAILPTPTVHRLPRHPYRKPATTPVLLLKMAAASTMSPATASATSPLRSNAFGRVMMDAGWTQAWCHGEFLAC